MIHRAIFPTTRPAWARSADTGRVSTDARPGPSNLIIDLAQVPDRGTSPDQRLLFGGYLSHPTQTAAALLLLGRVARHRFYLPPGMVAAKIASSDPVVTTSRDQLRFESFSACCGMALRYDVTADGIDNPPLRHGSTNIDLTGPTRVALAGVQGIDPLHLRISDKADEAVTFTTFDHTVSEPKAPLPQRWVRGFAEAQAIGAGLTPRTQISSAEARRFWRTLPRHDSGRSALFVSIGGRGLGLTGTPGPHAVPLGGPSRLRMIEPLLRYASSVTIYGPSAGDAGSGASLWQLDLADGRLSCALSPTPARGFSGEGGLLHQLADQDSTAYVELLSHYLDEDHHGELLLPAELATRLNLSAEQVRGALTTLAASGTVGYDAALGGYFHRELPWTVEGAEALNPRLVAARKLVAEGSVTITPGAENIVEVRHGDSQHRVRGHGLSATCTCPWIAQHGTSRGPCKHILAAVIFRGAPALHTVAAGRTESFDRADFYDDDER